MKKTKYAIIGNPISHSLSPTLHNYWFNKYNINAEYELLDCCFYVSISHYLIKFGFKKTIFSELICDKY